MQIKPQVAIALIAVVVVIVGFLLYKAVGPPSYPAPPPMVSGLSGSPIPGKVAPINPATPGKPPGGPASPRASTHIRSATASPPICCTAAPSCLSFRFCWDTAIRGTP